MKTKYLCPHCRATLNVERNIIFRFISARHVVGILILDPRLGRYVYLNPPNTIFDEGEKIEFICPVCCQFLKAKGTNNELVEILMINKAGMEKRIFFSSKAGEHTKFYIGKEVVLNNTAKINN